jgi:hypothetical protein
VHLIQTTMLTGINLYSSVLELHTANVAKRSQQITQRMLDASTISKLARIQNLFSAHCLFRNLVGLLLAVFEFIEPATFLCKHEELVRRVLDWWWW